MDNVVFSNGIAIFSVFVRKIYDCVQLNRASLIPASYSDVRAKYMAFRLNFMENAHIKSQIVWNSKKKMKREYFVYSVTKNHFFRGGD